MRIDLHTHSLASDGTQTPAELVAQAARDGLDVVALTDHDTTAGWEEAERAVHALPPGRSVALVRGIEISCTHRGISLHLLGYLHDPTDEDLLEELGRARSSRDGRARRIVDALAQDVDVTWDDVAAQVADGATVGRPHIADALVARGVVADRTEAFDRYLYTGSPYYVSYYCLEAARAVRLVRAAGGVPVMAHPFAAKRGAVVTEDDIAQLAAAGLAGLEAHHPEHTSAQEARAVACARELALFTTGSSDYHGAGKAQGLGARTTDPEVFERIVAQASGVPVVHP